MCKKFTKHQEAVHLNYKIFQSNLNEKEYGIALYENDKLISELPGVFSDKDKAVKITSLMNRLELEPCHLKDVLEDYLTYFSID